MIWLDAMHHYQRRTSINPYSLPKPIGLPAWSLHHNYFKQNSEKKTKSEPETNTNANDTVRKVDLEIPKLNDDQVDSNGDYSRVTEANESDDKIIQLDESKEEFPRINESVDFLFANPLTRKPELNENIHVTLAETEAPPIGFEDDYESQLNASPWKENWCTPTPPKPEYLSRHLLEMRGKCQFNVTNTLEFFSCVSPLSCRHIGWLSLLLLLLAVARLRSYAIAPAGFMRVSLRTSILACTVGLTLALCCEVYLHAALQLSMHSVKLHPADNAEIRLYMRSVGQKLDHASAILTYPYRGRRVDLETAHKYHQLVDQLIAINTNISKAHQGPEEYFYVVTPFTKAFLQFEHIRFQVFMVFWPLVLGVVLALAAFKFYLVATIFGAVSCTVAAVTLTTEAIAVADCCEAPRLFMDRVTAEMGLPSEEEHIRSQYNRVCGAWLTKFQKKLLYYEKKYAIVSQEMRQNSQGDHHHTLADIAQRITRVIEVELPKLHGVTTPRCDYQFKSATTVQSGDGTSSNKQAMPGPIYLPPADSVVRTLCHRDRKLQLLVAQIMLMMAVGTLMNLCVLFGFVTMKSLNSDSSPLNKLRSHIRRWKLYNEKILSSSRKSSKIRTQISRSRKSYSLVPRSTCVMGFTTTDSLLQYPTREMQYSNNNEIPRKRHKKFTRSQRQKLYLRSRASPTEGPWRLREDFTKHEKDSPKKDAKIKKHGWFFLKQQPKQILNKNTSSQASLPHQKSCRSKKRESPEESSKRLQTLFTTVFSQSENSFRVLCSSCESRENFMNSSFNTNIRACPADVSTSKANNNKRHRRVERREKRVRRCPIVKKSSPCNCGHSSKKKKKRRSKRDKYRSFKNYFRTFFEDIQKKKHSSIFSKNKHKTNPSSSFRLCRRCSKVMQKKRRDFSQSVYPQPTSFEGLKFKRKDIACQVNRISSQNLCGPLNSVSSCHCIDRDKCPLTSKTFLDKAVDSPKSSELSHRVSWGKITKTSRRKVPKSGSKSSTYRTKLETSRKNSVKSFEEKINEVRERRSKPKKEKVVCPNKKIKKKDSKRCKKKYTKKGVVLNTFCDKCQDDRDEENDNSFHENIYEKVYPEHKISNFLRPESLLKNLSFKSNYCESDVYQPSQNCSPKSETNLKQYDSSLSSYFDSPQEYVPMCSSKPFYENTSTLSWEQSYQPEPEQEPKRSLPTLLQSLMKKQRH